MAQEQEPARRQGLHQVRHQRRAVAFGEVHQDAYAEHGPHRQRDDPLRIASFAAPTVKTHGDQP